MKTNNEIHEKISAYMDTLSEIKKVDYEGQYKNWVEGIIDALLWVIGDKSGFEI